MHNIRRVLALSLAITMVACSGEQAPPTPEQAAIPQAAEPKVDDALERADADELRVLARQAMQAQRLFAPARENAIEYYLRLRSREANDASALAALVDLQPQLVIAVEQAIANAGYPEARRMLQLLRQVDANAPALPRLQATIASAETAARDQALAVDAEARAKAVQAELDLRRQAQESAAKLAVEGAATRTAASTAAPLATASRPAPVTAAPISEPPRPAAPQPQPPQPQPQPVAAAPAPTPAATRSGAMPKLVRQVAPRYPSDAGPRNLAGKVGVAFTIDGDGNVESPRVTSSDLPRAFERAALQAVARWKFEATGTSHASSSTVQFDPPGQ
jgi:periplasmic protein TonB